jgi:hypothetical protein
MSAKDMYARYNAEQADDERWVWRRCEKRVCVWLTAAQ